MVYEILPHEISSNLCVCVPRGKGALQNRQYSQLPPSLVTKSLAFPVTRKSMEHTASTLMHVHAHRHTEGL